MATADIPKGETIIVYGGVIIPKSDILRYRKEFGDYDVPFDEEFSIAPTSKDEVLATGSVNHSCEPNIGWKNDLMLVAIRDIRKGEELTPDYAMHGCYPEPMDCNCGKPSCRKVISPDDWKNDEIRANYGEWFMPRIKSKFMS